VGCDWSPSTATVSNIDPTFRGDSISRALFHVFWYPWFS
jgi:hypothetical protein